ncbi:MAG: type III-B CRISPR-associated protein Cas10/Cmr2 [Gemmataceae bacterium]
MGHLLAISIGPVQEFIRAARRTRDLWFGSYLLSEISRAVARAIEENGGRLIFPPDARAENVANVIIAELPQGDPEEIVGKAKTAGRQRWSEFATEAFRLAQEVIRHDVWDSQVNDVLEFYSAWVTQTGNYREDRVRLDRLLAGRKNCRDFLPARGWPGVPKSSLDGLRETVLKDPAAERWPNWVPHVLRLRTAEQLDVVGVVKRIAGERQSYPSVSRVAADPWIRGHKGKLREVISACEELAQRRLLVKLDTEAYAQFADFPYEGTAVYRDRYHEFVEETGSAEDVLARLRKAMERFAEPQPYVAVLVADGDRIGAVIRELDTPDKNRAFSKTLASFAGQAKEIVRKHQGVLVYAGGDDVLAFLPLDTCLACARQLHDTFATTLADYRSTEGPPTLSVGIGIGHMLENLEDLLDYARQAERDAKQPDRDGLAVHLYKRGGSRVAVRSRWEHCPDKAVLRYAELMNLQGIPSKLPYDLHELVDLYRAFDDRHVSRALQLDVMRIVRAKQPRAGTRYLPEIETVVQNIERPCDPERKGFPRDLEQFTEALLIARHMAVALRQARRQPEGA